ncbi:diacylglycerol kinase family protein [Govanella unica]|uniref:Acylglycerol kinase family protein n=1 Tax=Govanella unica TaxID=2975056 RepID=A0A9X3TXN5_9PROT|nr:diacylglycerol kinase family protein [Govania unica]MDA5193648.1 acylglycerol kinase family protein [Govania unica]
MNLVGVLSNPRSTRNQSGLDRVRDVVEDFDGVFHFEIDSISDISLALRRFAEQGVDVIAINGGDGTIQAVFSCLLRERPFTVMPPIAVLPAGKTNMIAEDLGAMSAKPHVYLRRLLELCRDERLATRIVRRSILRIEGIPGAPDLNGMFVGTAGIVRGIEFCRQIIYPLGLPNLLSHPLTVGLLFFGSMFGGLFGRSPLATEPIAAKFGTVEHEPQQYFVITATTLDRLILGLRPFGDTGQGSIKLLAVPQRTSTITKAFLRTFNGTLGRKPIKDVTTIRTDEVRLKLNCPITVDGELFDVPPDTEIRISGNEALHFVNFASV